MIDPGLARTILAIADAYRGPLPPHLVSLLHAITNTDDLPHGLRRAAVWSLKRESR